MRCVDLSTLDTNVNDDLPRSFYDGINGALCKWVSQVEVDSNSR